MKDFIVLVFVLAFGSLLENSIWAQQPGQPPVTPKPPVVQADGKDRNVTVNINENNGERETEVELTTENGLVKTWTWTGEEIPQEIQQEMEAQGLDASSFIKDGKVQTRVQSRRIVTQGIINEAADGDREVTVKRNGEQTTVRMKHDDGGEQVFNWNGKMPTSVAEQLGEMDPELRDRLMATEMTSQISLGAHLKIELEETKNDDGSKSLFKTIVDEVIPGGPASQAGLANGDIILKADGVELTENYSLIQHLQDREPGDLVKLLIERAGQKQNVDLKLGSK